MKKLDRVISDHFVPRLGKDWSKSDSKWPKTHYQAYSASQDLCSSPHEEQNIIFYVKVHAIGNEALILPLSNPKLT